MQKKISGWQPHQGVPTAGVNPAAKELGAYYRPVLFPLPGYWKKNVRLRAASMPKVVPKLFSQLTSVVLTNLILYFNPKKQF